MLACLICLFSLAYKNIPKAILSKPVTKNNCGSDIPKLFKTMIEKIAEPTINMALNMLLAPTMRARWLLGAYACIDAYKGTIYKPPLKPKKNKSTNTRQLPGIANNPLTPINVSVFPSIDNPDSEKYKSIAKILKPAIPKGNKRKLT